MLVYNFGDLLLLVLSSLLFVNTWQLYYLQNDNLTIPKQQSSDILNKKNVTFSENYKNIVFGSLFVWFMLLNYLYLYKTNVCVILWDTLFISNNNLSYCCFTTILLLLILIGSKLSNKQNVYFSSEYLIFVCFIIFFSYFILQSTNFFLTIFLLELVALLIFGKFTVSKILKNTNKSQKNSKFNKPLNQFSFGLFNSLFFQFWANFVSSVFLFFTLINFHYLYGTSNFFLINFFLSINSQNLYIPELQNIFILILLNTGFFIKLGLSPYQFFKIETYKGIPFFFIVVYTTLYLIVYVYFFINMYVYILSSLKDFVSSYVFVFIFISVFYLFSLIFDTKNFKAFLSYSTLITLISLLIITLML